MKCACGGPMDAGRCMWCSELAPSRKLPDQPAKLRPVIEQELEEAAPAASTRRDRRQTTFDDLVAIGAITESGGWYRLRMDGAQEHDVSLGRGVEDASAAVAPGGEHADLAVKVMERATDPLPGLGD